MKVGIYTHFKGNEYTVYGIAETIAGEKFVFYRENYGNCSFWIRPENMFKDRVVKNNVEVPRFKFLRKASQPDLFAELISLYKKDSVIIKHSETQECYKLILINSESKKVIVANNNNGYSSYLTDSQLSYRMGYNICIINDELIPAKITENLPERKKLKICIPNESDTEYQTKRIIQKQLNPCSIDLHISNDFFAIPKRQTINMYNMLRNYSKKSYMWKRIHPKGKNSQKEIVIRPNQTIVTKTLEQISLPFDCAGKIEIKSTYARLALSVTASDFCNPGWSGHFPLTIKNIGKHKIIIHPSEKMLQLSLVPTEATIVEEYAKKGNFMDDDGTPYSFWRSKTIEKFNSTTEKEQIFKFYNNAIESIKETSDNVEGDIERFESSFLLFCERKLNKDKYKDSSNIREKTRLLWRDYKNREKTIKFFCCKPVKVTAPILPFIPVIITALVNIYLKNGLSCKTIAGVGIALAVAIIIGIVNHKIMPECFCTFEKLTFEALLRIFCKSGNLSAKSVYF